MAHASPYVVLKGDTGPPMQAVTWALKLWSNDPSISLSAVNIDRLPILFLILYAYIHHFNILFHKRIPKNEKKNPF